MPGRKYSNGSGYKYGFNGKEKSDEVEGDGNIYDYGFRIYNPRISKFLSIDPLTKEYCFYSTYQFAGNNPIKFIDIDGKEPGLSDVVNEYKSNLTQMTFVKVLKAADTWLKDNIPDWQSLYKIVK